MRSGFRFSLMYSNTQFCTKRSLNIRIKAVDCRYCYTEALKIAHARKTCLCYRKSPHTQTLNSPRKANRLDCWFYFIIIIVIIIINQFIYFSIEHRTSHSCIRK